MEQIFGDQSFQSLLLYLDDIVIFSSSFHQHLPTATISLEQAQRIQLKTQTEQM